MSASKQLLSIPNIVLIVTGVYFLIVAGINQGSPYTVIGAILCFIAVGLSFEKDLFFAAPWRLATAAFSMFVLLVQLASDFTVVKHERNGSRIGFHQRNSLHPGSGSFDLDRQRHDYQRKSRRRGRRAGIEEEEVNIRNLNVQLVSSSSE